ncbi:hypothetical protein BDV96DRAFT_239944 [Lophiotrema nucula]|uniref:Uncharacterized protein n=1 Tax=Lophiotrema nucula TaxID=690887 RepID=A0A6A5YSV3_9PLEO|nr:hypothetical protein BDV96DRAFT_239944 [Lophiotrema nucula]
MRADLRRVTHAPTLSYKRICASAPALRPLLSKIPFSLSTIASKITTNASGSKRFSAKFSANRNVSGTTMQNSSNCFSATESKRRSEPIPKTVDTQDEITQDFELRQWDDLERGLHPNQRDSCGGSQDAILGNENETEDGPQQKRRLNNKVKETDPKLARHTADI